MKFIYLLLFILLSNRTLCQQGYNKTFDRGLTEAMFSAVYHNNTIIVFGLLWPEAHHRVKYAITQLDTFGNIIKWAEIGGASENLHVSTTYGVQIVYNDLGDLIIPLDYKGSSITGLIKFNINNWEIEFSSEFSFGTDRVVAINAIRQTLDGGYIFTGRAQRHSYDVDAYVLKASADGALEWLKYVGQNNLTEQGFSIVQTHENEYVIGGKKGKTAFLFGLDALGNMRWHQHLQDTADIAVRSLHKQQNGDWVYHSVASRPTTFEWDPVFNVSAPLFVRRDSVMNLITRKEMLPFAFMEVAHTMIPSRDGGWIMAGTSTKITDAGGVDSFYTEYGRVVKLDHDGDIEWQVMDTAFYSRHSSLSNLSGVVESPTGSIYAVGYCDTRPPNGVRRTFGWLLKITADGCVDTLCTTTSLLEQIDRLSNPVHIYPNPAKDYVTIDAGPGMKEAARIHFYDIAGREMVTRNIAPGQETIDTQHWPRGVYFWSVIQSDGVILKSGKLVVQ